jgi:mRNA interferase YafQ
MTTMKRFNVIPSTALKRDLKRAVRRGKSLERFYDVVSLLAHQKPLPPRCRDHALTGNWTGHRDCHIQPDWLLIYKIDGDDIILERTGTHSDLFG